MPREKDPFWTYVTPLNETNSKWRCNFCGQENRGGATRIKAHLAGIARFGIKGCERVDVDVKTEAREVLMPKNAMDSSNQGVPEERIRENFRAALTSTSHTPNVEGATNLQFSQVDDVKAEARDGLMPKKLGSSDLGVAEERIQGNVKAAPTSTSHPPNVEGGTNLQCPQGMPTGALAGASLCPYDRTSVLHSNEPLPSCNEECGTETSSFLFQELMDSDPLAATHDDLQVLEGGANMASLSSSRALLPPQRQSVQHQCINHKTWNAEQHPTVVTCHPQALVDMDSCIMSSSSLAPNSAPPPHILPCRIGLIGSLSLPELDMNKGAPMTSHLNTVNDFEENRVLKRKLELLYSKEADVRDELQFAAALSLKNLRMEVAKWLANVEKLRNDFHSIEATSEGSQRVDTLIREVEDLMRHGKGLFNVKETKVNRLLEGKMVGEAFCKNTKEVLECLVGTLISRLGIYGMGGVGKTTIMVHVYNRLVEKANYGNLLWITVSQDFNPRRLQDDIWKELGLGILQEKDVRKRASMLSHCLTKRGKLIIILDDLWERLDLEEVGIPVRANGFKLVLTTRSSEVCHQMQCQHMIKIQPLSLTEAEYLFLEELGSEVALNLEIKPIVGSIVKECAGLPLALIMMARSMRGMTDVFEWKDFLVKLRESDMGQTDMEAKVLMKLLFSYHHLGNHQVQQCFLSCALYPEDEKIDKFELIEFFIDQGLIDRLSTREKQYDRGLTILNKLENVCLLEYDGSNITMHHLIRDMALHIMRATSIIEAGKWLKSIPSEEYWTDALEKVSLIKNDIREFPFNMSPNCPKLSTCLLNRSLSKDAVIPDSFFRRLWGLKLLNLSGCKLKELPDSISNLVNLRALLLRDCSKLRHAPHLGKLRCLRKLDICGCYCLEALEGLEMLVSLRYLDLTRTHIRRLPKGTLGTLQNLQYLKVEEANVEDITKLWALETLQCCFQDVDDFNKFVRFNRQRNPRYYELNVDKESIFSVKVGNDAQFVNCERKVVIQEWTDAIVSEKEVNTDICILIPHDVQTLVWVNCNSTNLSGMGHFEYLESLNIQEWKNLLVFCGGQDGEVINIHDSPAPTPTPFLFSSLRILKISQCPKLNYLFGHGSKFFLPHLQEIELSACKEMVGIMAAVTSPPLGPPPAFPSLEKIYVVKCDKMKRLVEFQWLPYFPNLRSINVRHCENMEQIIGGPLSCMLIENSLESPEVHNCNRMRRLFLHEWLIHLRNLETIHVECCKGMVEMISGAGHGQEGSIMTPINNHPSSFESSISFPKLKVMWLNDLPQLKSICEVPMSCDSMKVIRVYKCPGLDKIPFQLRLGDIEDLPFIEVEGEEKWKTLMWDHPNAQAILQPYLHLRSGTCVLQRDKSH